MLRDPEEWLEIVDGRIIGSIGAAKTAGDGRGLFVYDFLVLSNMVSFSHLLLSLSLHICSQARYKFGLLYNFIIISFVLICFL